MRERREYTESFRQQALKRVYARGSRLDQGGCRRYKHELGDIKELDESRQR